MINFICSVESGIEREETVQVFHEPSIGDGLCSLSIAEQIGPTKHTQGVMLNKEEALKIAKCLMQFAGVDSSGRPSG